MLFLNVDLLFKNCLTDCLLQVRIIFVIMFAKLCNVRSSHPHEHNCSVRKLHVSVHARKKIESLLLLEANVLFI